MKVHPVPRKRNITLRYDVASVLAESNTCRQKKLRRLPHIFAKVLVLPFDSNAAVSIDETPEFFRFTAAADQITAGVRADAIEIYPGVTKVVIRGNGVVDLSGTELELDLWRFRLPACTLPELAAAVYEDGELVVTVPKGEIEAGNRLVLVEIGLAENIDDDRISWRGSWKVAIVEQSWRLLVKQLVLITCIMTALSLYVAL